MQFGWSSEVLGRLEGARTKYLLRGRRVKNISQKEIIYFRRLWICQGFIMRLIDIVWHMLRVCGVKVKLLKAVKN